MSPVEAHFLTYYCLVFLFAYFGSLCFVPNFETQVWNTLEPFNILYWITSAPVSRQHILQVVQPSICFASPQCVSVPSRTMRWILSISMSPTKLIEWRRICAGQTKKLIRNVDYCYCSIVICLCCFDDSFIYFVFLYIGSIFWEV